MRIYFTGVMLVMAVAVLVPSVVVAAPADERAAIAVLPLRSNTLEEKTLRVLDNLLVSGVDELGAYRVISPQDVSAVLGFDRMKQVAGCDDVSCAAELAGALGVVLSMQRTDLNGHRTGASRRRSALVDAPPGHAPFQHFEE